MSIKSEVSMLEEIISPITLREFKEKYWPLNPLVSPGNLERFKRINGFEKITSIEEALKIYSNPVMVVGDAVIEELEGISDRMLVPPSEALEWYEKGAALELDFTDLFIPQVRRWADKLKAELDLPLGTGAKAIVYAAKNGGGFKAHFDAYTNFIFQIKGKKTWKLQDNVNVNYPVQHYDLVEAPYLPEELDSYWDGLHPEEELPEADIVDLIPGTMLYLPRGIWHSTESNEETLALNITLGQPTWMDLFLSTLRQEMVKNEDFRKLAYNFNTVQDTDKEKMKKNLEKMIEQLGEIVNGLSSREVFHNQDKDFDPYQTTQLVFRQLLTDYKE
ncbi:JmjC domain-containing protein [Halobacillus trueperi]|uniref:Cupin domain-containing protein n=1 Tax=Halobacillus trueperi TaxID=156205 RepID=A0A3E0J4L0_9BACI|nr:cupin domain-containing protein [Halobacillus trueperi]REJ07945.1 cupin domain-containing protein [Halobacillus trueperi]